MQGENWFPLLSISDQLDSCGHVSFLFSFHLCGYIRNRLSQLVLYPLSISNSASCVTVIPCSFLQRNWDQNWRFSCHIYFFPESFIDPSLRLCIDSDLCLKRIKSSFCPYFWDLCHLLLWTGSAQESFSLIWILFVHSCQRKECHSKMDAHPDKEHLLELNSLFVITVILCSISYLIWIRSLSFSIFQTLGSFAHLAASLYWESWNPHFYLFLHLLLQYQSHLRGPYQLSIATAY